VFRRRSRGLGERPRRLLRRRRRRETEQAKGRERTGPEPASDPPPGADWNRGFVIGPTEGGSDIRFNAPPLLEPDD
jgi:hypothetical protein